MNDDEYLLFNYICINRTTQQDGSCRNGLTAVPGFTSAVCKVYVDYYAHLHTHWKQKHESNRHANPHPIHLYNPTRHRKHHLN